MKQLLAILVVMVGCKDKTKMNVPIRNTYHYTVKLDSGATTATVTNPTDLNDIAKRLDTIIAAT